jgi:hypothetical protein
MSEFTAHLFQTNASNAASGGGSTALTSSGDSYEAKVAWKINGVGDVKAQLKGKGVTQGGVTVIALSSPELQLTLVKNPYESRVSYAGCAAYGGVIYNLILVA